MIPGLESDPNFLNFTWVCKNFTNLYMDFELFYDFVDFISVHEYKDSIRVDFIGKDYFSADDGQTFLKKESVVEKHVPT